MTDRWPIDCLQVTVVKTCINVHDFITMISQLIFAMKSVLDLHKWSVVFHYKTITNTLTHWHDQTQQMLHSKWMYDFRKYRLEIILLIFASSHGWDVIRKYWSKLALFKGDGSLRWKGTSPPTIVGVRSVLATSQSNRMILSLFV